MRQPVARRRKLEFAGVERVEIDAIPLVTIGPDHDVWRGGSLKMKTVGAIVRLQPPEYANPEFITILVEQFFKDAASVKVLPPANGPAAVVELTRAVAATSPNHRAVVERMVQEARTGNRLLLAAVIEEALAHAGV